jgi:hypothetical protein
MNRKLIAAVVAVVIAEIVGGAMVSAQRQTPVVIGFIDRMTPPEKTLEERLWRVDAVMRIRVHDSMVGRAIEMKQINERNHPGVMFQQTVLPVSEYQTQVVEILKGDAYTVLGAPLRIGFSGGRAAWHGQEVLIESQHPPLIVGATYLAFLNHSEDFGLMMFAPEDIYRVDGPVVGGNPLAGTTEYGKQIVGQPSEEALSIVRSAVEPVR